MMSSESVGLWLIGKQVEVQFSTHQGYYEISGRLIDVSETVEHFMNGQSSVPMQVPCLILERGDEISCVSLKRDGWSSRVVIKE